MLRLTRLRIDQFRNVRPGTELHFGPTFNLLLGKNATGKTTLLDLIAAVTSDDLEKYFDAAFDLTWDLEDPAFGTAIRVRFVGEDAPRLGDMDLGGRRLGGGPSRLHVWYSANAQPTGELVVGEDSARWTPTGGPEVLVPRRDLREGVTSSLFALATAPQGSTGPMMFGLPLGRFDEALEVFHALTTRTPFVRFHGGGYHLGEGSLASLLVGVPWSADAEHLSLAEVGLPHAAPLLGFKAAQVTPREQRRRPAQSRTEYNGMDFHFTRADGTRIRHDFLSFGQKRLLAFLWYLAVRGRPLTEGPVIADELMNGLHHEWIKACVERLYDRQSFLATQHPYLLDHVPIESVESVRRSFVRCTLETDAEGREEMVWRNFTAEEAERFFVAYETGIQHVSEVLRFKGLW